MLLDRAGKAAIASRKDGADASAEHGDRPTVAIERGCVRRRLDPGCQNGHDGHIPAGESSCQVCRTPCGGGRLLPGAYDSDRPLVAILNRSTDEQEWGSVRDQAKISGGVQVTHQHEPHAFGVELLEPSRPLDGGRYGPADGGSSKRSACLVWRSERSVPPPPLLVNGVGPQSAAIVMIQELVDMGVDSPEFETLDTQIANSRHRLGGGAVMSRSQRCASVSRASSVGVRTAC